MKLQDLQEIGREQMLGIKMMLSLEFLRNRNGRTRDGYTVQPVRHRDNRESLRAAQRKTSEFPAQGHIYSGTVPAAIVAKRRTKNKAARHARAVARKRG